MLGLGLNIKPKSGGQLIGYYRLSETTNAGVLIVKKSDTAPKTILRYLDWEANKSAGTYPIYWDGLTDKGADVIAGGDWEAEIVTNKIAFSWTTALNSSAINHGSTLYHSYSGASGALAVDSKIVFIDLYNEAASRVAFYCSQSALQAKTNILGYGTPNSGNINATNAALTYTTYDANYIYFGGNLVLLGGTLQNIIHAVKRSDLTEVTFTNGITRGDASTRTYTSVIGDSDSTHILTGLCAANGFLYAAYAGQNKIDCMDCTSATTPSGAIVSTRSTLVDNCREIDWDSGKSRIVGLRTFSTDTEALFLMTINSGTGAMSAPTVLGLSVTAVGKKTLRINNNTHVLAILYGDTEQCIHIFDINPANPTGSVTSKIGVVGGMQSTSTVANDRFIFTDYSSNLTDGLRKPWLGVNLANDQWIIGDVGNERIVITSSTGTYVDKIQWQPLTYSVGQNTSDPYYMTAVGLVAQKSGSDWIHTKTYRQLITANYQSKEQYGIFQNIFTLTISGTPRVISTLQDLSYQSGKVNWDGVYSYIKTEIVELGTTLTYKGVYINPANANFVGVLQKYSETELVIYRLTSTSWAAGGTPLLKRTIIDYSSGSPVLGSETTICTLPAIVTNDALDTSDGFTYLAGVTDDGMAIVFNNSTDARFTEHLAGFHIASARKVFGTYFPTTARNQDSKIGYEGEFPDLRYYQRGNGTLNTFQNAKVAGNIVFLHEKQENYRAKQTAITNFWTSTGRPLTQVGITSEEGDAIEESAPRAAGNGISFHGAFDPTDSSKFILNYGDESRRSAISIEEGSQFNTISSKTAQILTPPNSEAFTANRYPILSDLTRTSVVATGGRITMSHSQSASFKAQTNILRWDQPDIYLYLDCASEFGSYKYAEIALDNPSGDLASWVLNGKINWYGYNGGESISTYPNIDPGAMIQVLDNNRLIIAEFGLGQGDVTDIFKLRCNGVQMLSYTDRLTAITRTGRNKDFTITTDIDSCTFDWDGEQVSTTFLNPSSNQFYPKYVRLVVRDRDTNHAGQRIISASDLIFEQILTGGVAPQLVSGNTYDANTLELVLNEQPSVYSSNGYSFLVNGVSKTPTSVSNVGNALRFVFSYTFLFGDVVTCSYTQSTGDTSRSGLELIAFTNSSVTNTIPDTSSPVLLQSKVDSVGGSGVLAFNSAVTAGSLIVVQFAGTIDLDNATCLDSVVGAYNFAVKSRNGYSKSTNMFYYYNHPGGSATITCAGINSAQVTAIYEYSNIYTAGNPLLDSGGALGSSSPLQDSLTFANNSLLVVHWYNEGTDDYTGLVGANVVVQHSVANYNLQGHKLSQAATTMNVGVTTGGNGDNVMTCAAFRII